MTVWGWKYKGTDERIKVGDRVELSARCAKLFEKFATVVGLQGFITVEYSDGTRADFDARSIKGRVS